MKLYLVQHGDALPKDADPGRPLSDTGHADVDRLAGALAAARPRSPRIIHSGKTRARQTAELLASALAGSGQPEAAAGLAPKDDPGLVAGQLGAMDDDLIVVSHLPLLANLLATLVELPGGRCPVDFRPGSCVCLERGDEGVWVISWMLRPELLSP